MHATQDGDLGGQVLLQWQPGLPIRVFMPHLDMHLSRALILQLCFFRAIIYPK